MAAKRKTGMTDWSVYLEMPHRRGPIEAVTDLIDDLLAVLKTHGAVGTVSPKTLGVQLSVDAQEADEAVQAARRVVTAALRKLRFKEPIILRRAEAQTMEELDHELQQSNIPDLVGVSEVALMLGVSKQRVSELARSRTLPPPLATLAAGPIWERHAVTRFVGRWPRRPGRPRGAVVRIR